MKISRVVKKIKIGFNSYGVAFGAGSVWVTSEVDGTVRRISAKTNHVTAKIKAGTTPNGVVYAFGYWSAAGRKGVENQGDDTRAVLKHVGDASTITFEAFDAIVQVDP